MANDLPYTAEKTSPPLTRADPESQQDTADNDSVTTKTSAFKSLGILDRFLAVWIFLAMLVGILLGNFVPGTGDALEKGKFVGVSVPIGRYFLLESLYHQQFFNLFPFLAVGLLVMMYPILCKVRYESLHEILATRDIWKQILFSVIMNWIVAPFLMVNSQPQTPLQVQR